MASAAMIVVGLVSAMALAQPEAGVRLDYQADARCAADEKAFIAEVHARSPRIRISPDASRSLVVRIVRVSPSKMAGRIELHEHDGTTTERTVSGASCEEIVSALGLVTALALDPTASTSTSADAGSPEVASTVATASTAQNAQTDASVVHRRDDDDEQATPLAERRWSFGAGADGEVVIGASPDPLFAVPVFFEATRAVGEHVGLGAGIRFERTGETSLVSGSGADFTWTVGALNLCVVLRAGRIRFDTCVRSHAGAIDAHGEGVVMTRSATRPWVDVGVALAIRFRIAGPVFVEAQGGIGVPLVQDRFFLEPNDTVFQASFLTGHVGGGLGFEIW